MPCNLYGPKDNYDLENSHFLPALIKKFHHAKLRIKKVYLWGNGKSKRELMHVNDLASACMHFLNINIDLINIGSGEEYTISQYAKKIAKLVNFKGEIVYQDQKLNGTPRKILDSLKAKKLGWNSKINFDQGLKLVYQDFVRNNY